MRYFIIISLVFLASCKPDDTPDTNNISSGINFYPIQDAQWHYVDSFSTSTAVDSFEDWRMFDTFRIGNQVMLSSSFIVNTGANTPDTLSPKNALYYEVLARSSFGYKPENSAPENYTFLSTNGEKVSGWVRFDEDSLHLYSLRKENNAYYEYLVVNFSCMPRNQWFSPLPFTTDSCQTVTVNTEQFNMLHANKERFVSGIYLIHHSHLWDSKYPIRLLKSHVGFNVSRPSFELLYNGTTYKLQ